MENTSLLSGFTFSAPNCQALINKLGYPRNLNQSPSKKRYMPPTDCLNVQLTSFKARVKPEGNIEVQVKEISAVLF